MSIESDRTGLREDSGEQSGGCTEDRASVMSVESDRVPLSCSNVAKRIRQALTALDAERLDLARERLVAMLRGAKG
jgi:hypothetical protein